MKDIYPVVDLKDNVISVKRVYPTSIPAPEIEIKLSFSIEEKRVFKETGAFEKIKDTPPRLLRFCFSETIAHLEASKLLQSKLIYSPVDTNRYLFKSTARYYEYKYKYLNLIDYDVLKDVNVFYMTMLDNIVYSNPDRSVADSIDAYAKMVNNIFDSFQTNTKFIGRNGQSRIPWFKNKAGSIFDINGLSSGEKQLFCRYMSFYMVEPNNAIIMVDEPENSLHPAWQQGIVSMFKKLGENNQVLVATQSPHVIASVQKENIRFFELTTNPNEPVRVAKLSPKCWCKFQLIVSQVI